MTDSAPKTVRSQKISLALIGLLLLLAAAQASAGEWVYQDLEAIGQERLDVLAGQPESPLPLPRLDRLTGTVSGGLTVEMTGDPALISPGEQTDSAGIVPRVGPCPASAYSQIQAEDYAAWPNRAVGRLTLTAADGKRYICSGSVVGENLILTAGHCVTDGGVFHSEFVFTPGYCHGPTLYGQFQGIRAVVHYDWLKGEDFRRDVGFILLQPAEDGRSLAETVGGRLGLAAGLPAERQTWDQYGYPYNLAQSKVLIKVTSSFGHFDSWSWTDGPTVGVGSNMLGGSSGGPWLLAGREEGVINGLNSYGYTDCDFTMYSPYLDKEVWLMYRYYSGLSGLPGGAESFSSR